MNVDMLATASGVAIKVDPVRWWMYPLAFAVIGVVGLGAAGLMSLLHAPDGARYFGGIAIGVAVAAALMFAATHQETSASNANVAAVQSHYGVSDLKPSSGGNLFATNDGSPTQVRFRDSRGLGQGSILIENGRATLYVKSDASHQVEYKAVSGGGGPYGYSGTAVSGITESDKGAKGN